jgi:hypothetical protein
MSATARLFADDAIGRSRADHQWGGIIRVSVKNQDAAGRKLPELLCLDPAREFGRAAAPRRRISPVPAGDAVTSTCFKVGLPTEVSFRPTEGGGRYGYSGWRRGIGALQIRIEPIISTPAPPQILAWAAIVGWYIVPTAFHVVAVAGAVVTFDTEPFQPLDHFFQRQSREFAPLPHAG